VSGVTIVVPALGRSQHLERALAALSESLAERDGSDEVLVVDDSGRGELCGWVEERLGAARVLVRERNGGFARAVHAGVSAARAELVFLMNSDLEPRTGFLEPLIDALEDARVFAAVPRVVRRGAGEARVESLVRLVERRGRLVVEQPFVERDAPARLLAEPCRVPFALGGACLVRRAAFLALRGFDELFAPFYLEDLDLCWRALRAGQVCLCVPSSVCVHENQATIARAAPRALVQAAIERNRLLFEWVHLDGQALERQVDALERALERAWLEEDRAALEGLALALEELDQVRLARLSAAPAADLAALARACYPLD
jgi:GT2 family glycosyltransferase